MAGACQRASHRCSLSRQCLGLAGGHTPSCRAVEAGSWDQTLAARRRQDEMPCHVRAVGSARKAQTRRFASQTLPRSASAQAACTAPGRRACRLRNPGLARPFVGVAATASHPPSPAPPWAAGTADDEVTTAARRGCPALPRVGSAPPASLARRRGSTTGCRPRPLPVGRGQRWPSGAGGVETMETSRNDLAGQAVAFNPALSLCASTPPDPLHPRA